jgi:putative colanic acid biosynthesis UDP-glucose lipid carrier transferase
VLDTINNPSSGDILTQPVLLIIVLNFIWLLTSISIPSINVFDKRKLRLVILLRTELLRSILLLIGYSFFLFIFPIPRVFTLEYAILLFSIWLIFSRTLTFYIINFYRSKGYNFRNIVIIRRENLDNNFEANVIDQIELGYKLKSVINPDTIMDEAGKATFITTLKKLEIDEVFIEVVDITNKTLDYILDVCDTAYVKVKLVTDIGISLKRTLKPENINDYILMEVSPFPLENLMLQFSKRLFDICFSLFVVVFVLSWLTPVIAVIIILESRGPVIFKQLRTGVKGDEFYCFKFRTMVVNHEADSRQAVVNDKRITKFGKFLRATSLDEMPQFYNVLIGNMSVVGPRPHMTHHTELFSQNIKQYFNRHYVKPGITGLAQVEGYRGGISSKEELEMRIHFDRKYVENWTFMLDLKIIMKTVRQVVASHSKAY